MRFLCVVIYSILVKQCLGGKDVNYEEGTRAVLEGIYEPPQEMIGEIAQFKDDPNHVRVDKMAEAMGLERIGWVFTSWPLEDDQLLSPVEVCNVLICDELYQTRARWRYD